MISIPTIELLFIVLICLFVGLMLGLTLARSKD